MATRRCGYSPEEDAVIRATYPSGGPGACAELLDRSASAPYRAGLESSASGAGR